MSGFNLAGDGTQKDPNLRMLQAQMRANMRDPSRSLGLGLEWISATGMMARPSGFQEHYLPC